MERHRYSSGTVFGSPELRWRELMNTGADGDEKLSEAEQAQRNLRRCGDVFLMCCWMKIKSGCSSVHDDTETVDGCLRAGSCPLMKQALDLMTTPDEVEKNAAQPGMFFSDDTCAPDGAHSG